MSPSGDQEQNKERRTEHRVGFGEDDEATAENQEPNRVRDRSHTEDDSAVHPDLEWKRELRGRQPGTRYVRIVRPYAREFRRRAPGHLVATEKVLEPRGVLGKVREFLRGLLIGSRLRTEADIQERTDKVKGLAIFASDNLSSSAYATEEVMRVLVLAGVGALMLTVPLTIAICLLLLIVVMSYLQVIHAYPGGGGSYVVAHENLGPAAGLAAAAALITDYILTVAVSMSAGVAAITSAFPELFAQRVLISVIVVAVVTIMNLRGIRESGTIFAAPTYVYLLSMLGLLGLGIFRSVANGLPAYTPPPEVVRAEMVEPLALLLILRAFASGSVALTGVEAVSNGVPAFKPPEVRNAQIVLVAMGAFFATIFIGISFLSAQIGIIPSPDETETVLSQLTRLLVGTGWYYYVVQFATAVLLVLAANTAFNGFPRLASILARDRYLPNQFQFRGDRLAYTMGIVVLAVMAAFLIVLYEGSVTGLIPLYMVGVFLAFTLSQAGLVKRWLQLRTEETGWRRRAAINALGAVVTGVVTVVVAVSKFALGAWMIMVLIPLLMLMMWGIKRHYRKLEDALTLERIDAPLPRPRLPKVVVPISRLDTTALQGLAYARSISQDVTAVHVTDDPVEAQHMKERWEKWAGEVPLVIVESPYRALIQPLLTYIDAVDKQDPQRPITVVLSELVPKHFWEFFLHNQTTLRLKAHLFFRPNTVVIDVPCRVSELTRGRAGQ
ncbi:MAG: APC family permease [Chloroflexi bacterium]|nr:APC family permease [Chloroflexota bacterium]